MATATVINLRKVSARTTKGVRAQRRKNRASLRAKTAICLGLLAATLFAYRSVLNQPFSDLDDQDYVVGNVHVNSGLHWSTVRWALTGIEQCNWHPLTWLSHALDVQLYGMNAGGHHLTNLLLHFCNVILLFLLMAKATGLLGRSSLVAALFALHPLNVETVAWVAERKNLLCTLFFFLALAAYGWYARKPGTKRYLTVVALFLLGLASKPMVITLPFVLILLDFWPLGRVRNWTTPSFAFPLPQRTIRQLILEKLPLLAGCVASAVITLIAQSRAVIPLSSIPFRARWENAIYSYAAYIWRAFWPVNLALYYPHTNGRLPWWGIAAASIFLVAVSVAVWKERARKYLVIGWLFFLGTLVPVIGLVQVGDQAMADRYMYIPLLGIFVMVVWSAADWAARRKLSTRTCALASAVVLVALFALTIRQVSFWKNSFTLWSHTAAITKDNAVAEKNAGDALVTMDRAGDALPYYEAAVKLRPQDPMNHVNVGSALQSLGRLQDATVEYQAAIRVAALSGTTDRRNLHSLASAYANLGTIQSQLGQYEEAIASYRDGIDVDPQLASQVIPAIARCVALKPTARGYLELGQALEQSGRAQDAANAYRLSLALDPALVEAREALKRLNA